MEVKKDGDRFHFLHESSKDSASPVVKCLIDGVDTKFHTVNDPEGNQLARWQLISKELEFVESQLKLAIARIEAAERNIYIDRRDEEGVLIKSLVDSAIVGYIKCFNQTKGRKVKLEVRELFDKYQEKSLRQHHIKVKELRDSYIAHAGISENEGSHMIACFDEKPPTGQSKEVVIAHAIFCMPQVDFLKNTLKLVKYVSKKHLEKYQEKLNNYCQKLIDDPRKYGVEKVFKAST